MLKRFRTWEGYESIPLTGGNFVISAAGEVLDIVRNIRYSKPTDELVEINDGCGWKKVWKSVLLAIVSKRSFYDSDLWDKLTTNSSPDKKLDVTNLIVFVPPGGLESKQHKGFYLIPGFSRYFINKDGEIYSRNVGRLLSSYTDKLGYQMFGIQPDLGKRTILGQHRFLALAFIPYPENIDDLDVNHKDGIKGNNALLNLEWVTRQRNCEHAYSTGLRTDNIGVLVRNSFTKEILTFYSMEDAARQLNVGGETIRVRLRSRGKKIYPPGLQFKRSDDSEPWVDFKDPHVELLSGRFAKEARIVYKSGDIKLFSTVTEAAANVGIKFATVASQIRKHGFFNREDFYIDIALNTGPTKLKGLDGSL